MHVNCITMYNYFNERLTDIAAHFHIDQELNIIENCGAAGLLACALN